MQSKLITAALIASIVFTGCSRETPERDEQLSEEDVTELAPASPPAPAVPAQTTNESEMSVEDIDRWQRGMEAELKATQAAAAKLAEAKDDNAKLEALHGATEMGTIDAGAEAAGVDLDRYRRIRNTISNAVSQLSPLEMEMDVSQMPPEMVEQMTQARAAGVTQLEKELPADVLEALKTRAAELRKLDKTLVGERLKVAMSAR
jgi:hypothetical protein